MPRLVNKELDELVDNMKPYRDDLIDIMYEQYKNATILSTTDSLWGVTGDDFKEYMSSVHLHLTERFINITGELYENIEKIREAFNELESSRRGVVGNGTIEDLQSDFISKKDDFEVLSRNDLNLLYEASQHISTTNLDSDSVASNFSDSIDKLESINIKLEETAQECKSSLSAVKDRVEQLKAEIKDIKGNYHDSNGIVISQVNSMTSEPWYSSEYSGYFKALSEDEPFTQKEWGGTLEYADAVAGRGNNLYATVSANGPMALGYTGKNNRGHYGYGEVELFGLNGEGQVGNNFLSGETESGMLHGEGGYYFGEDGFDANVEMYALQTENMATLGNEDFNLHLGTKASLGSVDAALTCTSEEVDVGSHYSGPTAEVSPGFTLFGVDFTLDLSLGFQAGSEIDYSAADGYFSADGSFIGGIGFKIDW